MGQEWTVEPAGGASPEASGLEAAVAAPSAPSTEERTAVTQFDSWLV